MNAQTETTNRQTHPLVMAAAGAVIVASLAVAGVSTGLIKTGDKNDAAITAETTGADAVGAAGQANGLVGANAGAQAPAQKVVVANAAPRQVAAAPKPAPAAAAPCRNCGEVSDVIAIERKGEGSGLGAVAGGLAGALLGKQVGNGSGQKVATVAGAIGGAYAGHQIEKNAKSDMDYQVVVRFDDGTTQRFSFDNQPTWRVGDDVKVVDGRIVSR